MTSTLRNPKTDALAARPQPAPPPPAGRARLARCGVCWAEPGQPCGDARGDLPGLHLARYARARRKGLITGTEMTAVLATAGDVFTGSAIVPDGAR